jgi:hypothetical protein
MHDTSKASRHSKTRKAFLLCLVIVLQIVLLFWVHNITDVMRQEWPLVVKSTPGAVYVIQTERFWGPVTAIVPERCREMERWQDSANSTSNWTGTASSSYTVHDLYSRSGAHGKDEAVVSAETSMKRQSQRTNVQLQTEASNFSLHIDQRSQRKLEGLAGETDASIVTNHSMVVHKCNESMTFEPVGWSHQYFAMIIFSNFLNHFTGGIQNSETLHRVRIASYYQLFVAIMASTLLKYLLVIFDLLAQICGHHYVQMWNEGRTKFDRALEAVLFGSSGQYGRSFLLYL